MISQLRTNEGVVYGAGHTLPTADQLTDYGDMLRTMSLTKSAGVVVLDDTEGEPSHVLRLEYSPKGADDEHHADLVQLGIDHFDRLRDCGISLPAQRFVIAPSPIDNQSRLFAFTEYIAGKPLRGTPAEASYSGTTIAGLAQYLRRLYPNEQPSGEAYLFDLYRPSQHTASDTVPTEVVLHDVGLEFTLRADDDIDMEFWREVMAAAVKRLLTWSYRSNIEPAPELQHISRLAGVDWKQRYMHDEEDWND